MDLYRIAPHLDRAKALLASNDQHQWIYAALELRFAFESASYRQVAAYGEDLPSTILREWKPDQLMKLLSVFDDTSDLSIEYAISLDPLTDGNLENVAPTALNFVDIGKQNRIPWSKFRKSYNALGSFLHLDKQQQHHLPSRESLAEFFSQLTELAQSTTIVAKKNFFTSTCECGELLVLGQGEISGKQLIYCPKRTCNRIYRAQPNEPGCPIEPLTQVAFDCLCGARIPFAPDKLLVPTVCPNCRSDVALQMRLAIKQPLPTEEGS
ncbi:hypothetical protein [Xanthomonas translucens]|uniref:hypothetical protein n=1 Tax=Xanthomonas campestris pv. translucens TaxID=343 RepID=UPI001F4899B4|nr:hypothetical protein [Xanthomonas translucens]UJB15942.1 hypothetical protein LTC53_04610 [Xanthomonas translucens pv. undulosa]